MLIHLLTNPVFFIIVGGLILLSILIVHLERHHMANNSVAQKLANPLYNLLEDAEHRNCRLTFCQANSYEGLGQSLECNIHNVGKEWVHITYPINTEDDVHKIISIDKIAAVELINDDLAS